MDTNHCMASAISAGLGAMTFRNHLRSLTEISDKAKSRLKTAGKIGAGVTGAALAGYGAVKGYENRAAIGDSAGKALGKVRQAGWKGWNAIKGPDGNAKGGDPDSFKNIASPLKSTQNRGPA